MSLTGIDSLAYPAETRAHTFEPVTSAAGYNLSVGYLRAFVTVLVLAHHAVLAYHPFAPAPPASLIAQPRWWMAFPVVDAQRWSGFTWFVGFNDIFFMSLMFFLSGLFVWKGLERKGGRKFLRDRALRLGLPFMVAAVVLGPLAYYPTYLQTGHRGLGGFWHEWLGLGSWPAGPAWFVWVLLAFDCIAAALFWLLPKFGETLGCMLSGASRRPVVFFGILVGLSAAVYVPMAVAFNPFRWSDFGPFFFQTSRILHYLVYFLIAIGVGVLGTGRGLLACDGKLARRWPLWTIAALVFFGVAVGLAIAAMTAKSSPSMWTAIAGVGFTLSCAASSLAFLALFVRFAKTPRRIFDSLRDNAYGMYLVHYAFVSWVQYALLRAHWSGAAKGLTAFACTLGLSWMMVAGLRRIPAVARVI
jgi:peptidoglycan/LPS O-acetylase OafA/YrhL